MKPRPKPDDFEDIFHLYNKEELMAHYSAGRGAVDRWLAGRKAKGIQPRRKLPADFAQVAPGLSAFAVRQHYNTTDAIVARWYREAGIDRPIVYSVPPPSDFAEMATKLTKSALRKHYDVGTAKIARWLVDAAVDAKTYTPPPRHQRPKTPWSGYKLPHGHFAAMRTTSIYEDAADVLRRFCPVYRCHENGKADEKGEFWRVGMSVLTPDELLERADKYRKRAA